MITINFSAADIEALRYWRFQHPDPRVQIRMEALYWRSQRMANEDILRLCGIGVSTDRLHGFGRFNLQNISRREGVRRRGSADHLIRLQEERWGDGEAERLGGLEIDHQLEFHRLLHGQVARLGAFQNLVHVYSDAAPRSGLYAA